MRLASINGVNILLILCESALCIIATILISRKINAGSEEQKQTKKKAKKKGNDTNENNFDGGTVE